MEVPGRLTGHEYYLSEPREITLYDVGGGKGSTLRTLEGPYSELILRRLFQ
jgi:hypothetical protein